MQPALTENGAISYPSSEVDPRVAFFFKVVRDTEAETVESLLVDSWNKDNLDTLRLIFHLRDCRGGKGEKKKFHECLSWLVKNHPSILEKNLDCIPFYGSYKDWLVLLATSLENRMIESFTGQLKTDLELLKGEDEKAKSNITLAAKWAPTEGCAHDRKFDAAKKFSSKLGVNNAKYRKEYLVPLREHLKIIETLMCQKEWDSIDFSKVPSVALKRYKKCFRTHAEERYADFLIRVKAGTAKMNVNRLHPHEILEPYLESFGWCSSKVNTCQLDETVELQWKTFVDNTRKRWKEKGKSLSNSIVLADVSGSMSGTPICVSVALGMLIAELNEGPFHSKWITFSTDAKIEEIKGDTVLDRVRNMIKTHWDGNTNFQAAFDNLLTAAKMLGAKPDQMPSTLFIISDMEFDEANPSNDRTNYEEIEAKYKAAGYTRPRLVFWNVRSQKNIQFPVTDLVPNCALVSGFSADLLDIFLDGEEMNGYEIMRKVIDSPRYERVKL